MAHSHTFKSNLCIAEELQDLYDLEYQAEWETVRKAKALRQERKVAEAEAKEVRALAEAQVVEEEQETASPTPLTFIEEVVVMFDNMGVDTVVLRECPACGKWHDDYKVFCQGCYDSMPSEVLEYYNS